MRRLVLAFVLAAACAGDDDGAAIDAAATGDDAGAADAAAVVEVCDGLTAQDPEPAADVTYGDWQHQGCFDSPCLCSEEARPFVEDVLACRAVDGGYYWGLGSEMLRVSGRSGDDCVIRVGNDLEGSNTVYECALPLPVQPWPGIASNDDHGFVHFLDGIEDLCTEVGTCSLLGGGPNPCWEDTQLAAPYCTQSSGASCP